MSLNFIIIILGWQLTIVIAGKPSLDEVRSLIKKVRGEADTIRNSNIELNSEISHVQTESIRKISDFNIEKYNLSTEFKEEMDKLKMLQSNLSSLYQEEHRLSHEVYLVQGSRDKLQLGIKLLEEDIEQLQSRKKRGVEERCLKVLPTVRETKLTLRSANSSEEDEMIVLSNELAQEKSRLDEFTNKNEELQLVLKDKKKLASTALQNLESIISEIDGDISKAKVRVDILKEKCDKKTNQIASLRENLKGDLSYLNEKKDSLENLRNSMVEFGPAIKCYNRLEEEVFHKNY